jgi:hypothetical protein
VSVRLGAIAARDALARSHFPSGALVATLLVIGVGLACRTSDASGADRALLGVTLPVVLPLACFAVLEAVYGRGQSSLLIAPLARHGADRHELALGATLVAVAVSAMLGALLSVLAELTASPFAVSSLGDFFACTWGGALVGATYAGLFALGSVRARSGRLWLLLGDWVFGSGSGAFALPWARGHARNLLGGEAVLGMSPGFAAGTLALITALAVVASARRGPS